MWSFKPVGQRVLDENKVRKTLVHKKKWAKILQYVPFAICQQSASPLIQKYLPGHAPAPAARSFVDKLKGAKNTQLRSEKGAQTVAKLTARFSVVIGGMLTIWCLLVP